MKQRKIIHVDMDAFYVSVEIRDKPELNGKPVAVGGKRGSRGVLSTCNYIAREYGVHSAMPTSVALRKCPSLILMPGRMHVYKEISHQIINIFERYTDLIEPLSLDEAYLDVSECTIHNGSATLIAEDICNTIFNELNLTASAGVAPIKFLAKVASDLNKPNGIYTIPPKDIDKFINDLPLNKIPGIGKVTYEKLCHDNLINGHDIKSSNEAFLINKYGKLGMLLWNRCHGIDDREVVTSRERKSVGVERTFPEDISDISILNEILKNRLLPELYRRAAKHVKEQRISKIGVKVKFSDFQQTTKEFAIDSIDEVVLSELLTIAIERGHGKRVRLLGVHIGLTSHKNEVEQISFEW
jgi:DNA polymerase IV